MDTKKRNYSSIVNGPSAQRMLMNFSLWGEIIAHRLKYDLNFSLDNGWKMVCSKIASLEHEDGSDYCFNVVGDVRIFDKKGKERFVLPNAEFFYSARTRSGTIATELFSLLFESEKSQAEQPEEETAFNPS